jgi:uncharacterized protein involved in exopolysaccharide biosynthesis
MTHELTPTEGLRSVAAPGVAALPGPLWPVRPGGEDRDALSLSLLLHAVRQHARLIAAVGLIAGVFGWGLAMLLPAKYQAAALIRVDGDGLSVLDEDKRDPSAYVDPVRIQSWVQAITGLDVLREAAATAGLRYYPEFNSALAAAGKPRREAALTPQAGKDAVEDGVVAALAKSLMVTQVGQSGVAEVAIKASDPLLAARAVNAVGQAFIDRQILSARERRLQALDALTAQRDELNARLKGLEQGIVRTRAGSKLVFGETTDVAGDVFANIRQQLITSESDLAAAMARRQVLDRARSAGAGASELPEIAFSDLIQALRQRRAQAAVDLAEVGEIYGPRHPEYLKKQEMLAKVDRSIAQELESLSATVRNEERALQNKVATLRQRLQDVQGEATEGTSSRVQLARLQSEADATKASLTRLEDQIDSVETAIGLEQAAASFVSRALPPDAPVFPKKPLIAAAASVAGGGLAFLFVAARSLRDRRIRTAAQLKSFETISGYPVVATLPMQDDSFEPEQVSMGSNYARSLLDLSMTLGLGSHRVNSVVVAPLQSGDGGSSLAASLALLCRGVGLKTLLVELDPDRAISRMFGGEEHLGLADCAQQGIDPEGAIWVTEEHGLQVLSYGSTGAGGDYQTMSAVEQSFERLRTRYDLVILDAPPLAASRHACRLAQHADQLLVVTLPTGTRANALAYNLRSLDAETAAKVAVVFNKATNDSELVVA